jgi:hypothetical protein
MQAKPSPQPPPTALIEWLLWTALITGMLVLYITLGVTVTPPPEQTSASMVSYAGLLPLTLSCVVRWVLLPRITNRKKRLPIFIVGMAMAEGSGLLALFLGGDHRDTLFTLGVLGVAQYLPPLLPRTDDSPKHFR